LSEGYEGSYTWKYFKIGVDAEDILRCSAKFFEVDNFGREGRHLPHLRMSHMRFWYSLPVIDVLPALANFQVTLATPPGGRFVPDGSAFPEE
jgi:hypothetical protein